MEDKKPSNPRIHNPDGIYAIQAIKQDYFSLRDLFANSAMQASLTSPELMEVVTVKELQDGSCFEALARVSYKIADAMLKQRELCH